MKLTAEVRKKVLAGKVVHDPEGKLITEEDVYRYDASKAKKAKPPTPPKDPLLGAISQISEQTRQNAKLLEEIKSLKVSVSKKDDLTERVIVQTSPWKKIVFDLVRNSQGHWTDQIIATRVDD